MPGEGMYTQRDPIGLAGGNPTTYGYVYNTLQEVDPFGLNCSGGKSKNNNLDWSRKRHDGLTTRQHVELHNINNLSKPKHGVFLSDGFNQTNNAWTDRAKGTFSTQANGNDIRVIPSIGAGIEGGFNGSGNILNNITIITENGTNKIVTAFPSR